ncbi:transposase, partial [Candidatus Solirubrobacter pratensis]|uniref:transposase n=1 Tax=Candidatus Solirubrobacter pratensis TaxID=1298857 RepID=UPI0009DBDBEE
MLRLSGGQVESLFDLGLPVHVAELPADLAVLDELLAAPGLLAPIEASWAAEAVGFGRPTVAMDRFVRLMIVKARSGWGYETLVKEVSDSLHLRRFCRIGLWDRVPDESTIRKLVRRLGADVIEDICSQVIAEATSPRAGARRFVVRAGRIDSTVVESDIRYPTDLGLAQDAARALAREAVKARGLAGAGAPRVKDRSRAIASRLRRVNRSVAARTGHSRPLALRLTGEAGELLAASIREARRLVARLRERARGRGAAAKQAAAARLERFCVLAEKVCTQIKLRLAGKPITDRLVSISDPDARPIRKGKLNKPTEFGYVMQLTELCENTRRGARGLILPASTGLGSLNESQLLPATGQRLGELNLRPREIALDGGFTAGPVRQHLPEPDRLFISGHHAPHARKTNRRL